MRKANKQIRKEFIDYVLNSLNEYRIATSKVEKRRHYSFSSVQICSLISALVYESKEDAETFNRLEDLLKFLLKKSEKEKV